MWTAGFRIPIVGLSLVCCWPPWQGSVCLGLTYTEERGAVLSLSPSHGLSGQADMIEGPVEAKTVRHPSTTRGNPADPLLRLLRDVSAKGRAKNDKFLHYSSMNGAQKFPSHQDSVAFSAAVVLRLFHSPPLADRQSFFFRGSSSQTPPHPPPQVSQCRSCRAFPVSRCYLQGQPVAFIWSTPHNSRLVVCFSPATKATARQTCAKKNKRTWRPMTPPQHFCLARLGAQVCPAKDSQLYRD